MATPTATRLDPLPSFAFLVRFTDLPNTVETFFKSVGGLRCENEVIPVAAGGANDTTFNLVGRVKWSPLVFKQGFTRSSGLLAWREMWTKDGKKKRSGGTIIQLDTALKPAAEWTFVRGWPSKWEIAELDAARNEVSIETLEICHEGLTYAAK